MSTSPSYKPAVVIALKNGSNRRLAEETLSGPYEVFSAPPEGRSVDVCIVDLATLAANEGWLLEQRATTSPTAVIALFRSERERLHLRHFRAMVDGFLQIPTSKVQFVERIQDVARVRELANAARARHTESLATVTSLEDDRKTRDESLSMLVHDTRLPLAAARLGSQLVLRSRDFPEGSKANLERVVYNIGRADRMLAGLLDLKRIKSGAKFRVRLETCDLVEVIGGVLTELKLLYGERFRLLSPAALTGNFNADGVTRVVENLCSNAAKYGTPATEIQVAVTPEKSHVCIAVHNLGNPIPSEEHAHLFEAFRRTRSSESGKREGWGLGLALVKSICESVGGSITVSSSAERGTTFEARLPFGGAA